MQPFSPQKIILERGIEEETLTRRVLQYFPHVARQTLDDARSWKAPGPLSPAKRVLMIARQRGEVLKPFPKVKFALNLGDYVFNPISNCHLECTYCILQSYLKNNPSLTLFSNLDYFRDAIRKRVLRQPGKTFRIGTGELSDSLALDSITQLSRELIPFFADLPNAYLELKTKSDLIENLLDLPHGGHAVISWSLSPDSVVRQEELKCASLKERLSSAKRIQSAGYPVGLHLDPLIYFEGWEGEYQDLIEQVSHELDPKRIAWVSVGSLRFDKGLKREATLRFPHTQIFTEDFVADPAGKFRYFKTIRAGMYQKIWTWLKEWSAEFPRYLCMEPPWMWERVTGKVPPGPQEVEQQMVQRLIQLQGSPS